MSVIGVDDVEMASMSSPPLTTVRMPKESAGRRALRLALERPPPYEGQDSAGLP